MAELINGNQQWVDNGGVPLNLGKVYIGDQNADPILNPKSIFSNRALSSALDNTQILSSTGFSTNKIWLSGRYSIRVENSAGVLIKQELDNGEADQTGLSSLSSVVGINAITANNTPTITSYEDKSQFIFQAASLNTTDAVTLNIDGVGVKAIKRNFDQDVGKGKFKASQTVIVAYNSGNDNFEWTNENARVVYQTEGADIASAATIDLSLATGNAVTITGSTGPVTSLGTVLAGVEYTLTLASTPTFTQNATSLILPGAVDFVGRTGDELRFLSLGSGNFKCINVQRASVNPNDNGWTFTGSIDLTSGSPTIVSLASSLVSVSEIEIFVLLFSTNSANQAAMIQIGDSGGLETSGYSGTGYSTDSGVSGVTSNSSGFLVSDDAVQDAALLSSFNISLKHMGSNVWTMEASGSLTSTIIGGEGAKTLSGALDRVSITTSVGSATFDSGTAHVRSR